MNRSDAGRIGAYTVQSLYDARDLTAAARKAASDRFERQVDPDNSLDPDERHRRADAARKAHMLRLAALSAQARKKAKG